MTNAQPTLTPTLERLTKAYLKAREELELQELDLNRAKIVLVDQHGKIIRTLNAVEH
jgi:hypothetical protein